MAANLLCTLDRREGFSHFVSPGLAQGAAQRTRPCIGRHLGLPFRGKMSDNEVGPAEGLGDLWRAAEDGEPLGSKQACSPLVSQSWKETAPSCLVVRPPPQGKHRVRPASGW